MCIQHLNSDIRKYYSWTRRIQQKFDIVNLKIKHRLSVLFYSLILLPKSLFIANCYYLSSPTVYSIQFPLLHCYKIMRQINRQIYIYVYGIVLQ